MKTSRALIVAFGASAFVLASPCSAEFNMIVTIRVVVLNNSSATVTCRYKKNEWSAPLTVPPENQFSVRVADVEDILFKCDSPVEPVVYRLKPSRRYSLLRSKDGIIRIREITPKIM